MNDLTCIHAEKGLCKDCFMDYCEDPEAYVELGDHERGLATYQALLEEMAAYRREEEMRCAADPAAPAPGPDDDTIPF
jgi:hypothetical protein